MEKTKPKLKLIGEDGNAFSILGRARRALRRADYTEEQIEQYVQEAMSGDYNNLLITTSEWFDVE